MVKLGVQFDPQYVYYAVLAHMQLSHNMTLCARVSYEAMPLPRTTIGVLPPNFHGGHLATNYQNYDWGLAAKFSLRGLPAALGHAHQPLCTLLHLQLYN